MARLGSSDLRSFAIDGQQNRRFAGLHLAHALPGGLQSRQHCRGALGRPAAPGPQRVISESASVIIQTMNPGHYSLRHSMTHDYDGFYGEEIAYRTELGYPPVVRMAKVVAVDEDVQRCREAAEEVAELLAELLEERLPPAEAAASLIGPAPCFFARHRVRTRWQVVLRAPDPAALLRALPLPPNCWVDVDPVSLL